MGVLAVGWRILKEKMESYICVQLKDISEEPKRRERGLPKC